MEITSARDVAISGSATLSVVHRDQYNQMTVNNRTVHVRRPGRTVLKRARKRRDSDPEYDQYREVIRGDIHKLEQLSAVDVWDSWERKDGQLVGTCHSYRRMIHQVRVYGDDRVFTSFSYHGRDAEKIWKEEFMKYSPANDPAVLLQLFAINRSKVPALLFHDEWLPLGHLYEKVKVKFWESFYLGIYAYTLGKKIGLESYSFDLWLNSRTALTSSGPRGPYVRCEPTEVLSKCEDIPSALEMLDSNACVEFLNKTGARDLDLNVIQYAGHYARPLSIGGLLGIDSLGCGGGAAPFCWEKNPSRGPWLSPICKHILHDEVRDFIGKLCPNAVYSGAQLGQIALLEQGVADSWETLEPDVLFDKTLIGGGLMRFQFNNKNIGDSTSLVLYTGPTLGMAWLSQAARFSEASAGSSEAFIPCLVVQLNVESQLEQPGISTLETPPTVYLFIQLPSPTLADFDSWTSSQISFWSFDKNGISKISEFESKCMNLPNVVLSRVRLQLKSWPKHVYDAIHAWQIARGFDPATADFARSLNQPILEPAVKQVIRFEGIGVPKENEDSASTGSWWSWSAIPQSDISAFAI
ncbi:hypothetical protein Moror_16799 [Moniliophthora roreri MCA 2997]|uniref:Uncharacterized protein n=2 Tax=Moniliophthora roreri TaxID=221103 RepID=V2YDN9_MONRO|nr:hypothetical protein Moror_16799 [Moniliophthora roreri MCA 2997]